MRKRAAIREALRLVLCADGIDNDCDGMIDEPACMPVDLVFCRGRTDMTCVYGELNEGGGPVGLTGCQ